LIPCQDLLLHCNWREKGGGRGREGRRKKEGRRRRRKDEGEGGRRKEKGGGGRRK
jgi:hypothetical protein